ncbi:hypothetical protein HWQ67_02550, partial [Candidatus Magnetobacterium casensis]
GTLTKACNFAFVIFNPTRSKGYAVDTHGKFSDYWLPVRWNAEDSEISDKDVIARVAEKYGKDSNPYRIRVLGLPPLEDELTLIPADWVMDAVDREVIPLNTSPVIKGLDCGAGGDKSVIVTRKGGKVYGIKRLTTPDSQSLINWALNDFSEDNADVFRVDNIGIGWAVYGALNDRLGSCVEAADCRRKADDSQRFVNKRAEMYWILRTQFEKGCISIPNDTDLIDQLTAMKATYESGKVKIIEKSKLKAELGHSPDECDSLALTYYFDDIMLTRQTKGVYCFNRTSGFGNSSSEDWLGA